MNMTDQGAADPRETLPQMRRVPREVDGRTRLVRCRHAGRAFENGKGKTKITLWGINFVIANAVLTAISRDGISPLNTGDLRACVAAKLKQRFGDRVTCERLGWEEGALAFGARITVWPLPDAAKKKRGVTPVPEMDWWIAFWEVGTVVERFQVDVLPLLVPAPLVNKNDPNPPKFKYDRALRMHEFNFISSGRKQRRLKPLQEGGSMQIVDQIVVSGTLYGERHNVRTQDLEARVDYAL